jgi:hypothetical protein
MARAAARRMLRKQRLRGPAAALSPFHDLLG